MKASKKIPFDFVLDELATLEPRVKPMFGSYGVYVGDLFVMVLRQRSSHPEANGVWLATTAQHHESLRKHFPNMTSVFLLSDGKAETNWQMLPEEADDFEQAVIKLCRLILMGDERIGTIPKPKKKKAGKPKN